MPTNTRVFRFGSIARRPLFLFVWLFVCQSAYSQIGGHTHSVDSLVAVSEVALVGKVKGVEIVEAQNDQPDIVVVTFSIDDLIKAPKDQEFDSDEVRVAFETYGPPSQQTSSWQAMKRTMLKWQSTENSIGLFLTRRESPDKVPWNSNMMIRWGTPATDEGHHWVRRKFLRPYLLNEGFELLHTQEQIVHYAKSIKDREFGEIIDIACPQEILLVSGRYADACSIWFPRSERLDASIRRSLVEPEATPFLRFPRLARAHETWVRHCVDHNALRQLPKTKANINFMKQLLTDETISLTDIDPNSENVRFRHRAFAQNALEDWELRQPDEFDHALNSTKMTDEIWKASRAVRLKDIERMRRIEEFNVQYEELAYQLAKARRQLQGRRFELSNSKIDPATDPTYQKFQQAYLERVAEFESYGLTN